MKKDLLDHINGRSSVEEVKWLLDNLHSTEQGWPYLIVVYALLDERFDVVKCCVNHSTQGPKLFKRFPELCKMVFEEGLASGWDYMQKSPDLNNHLSPNDVTYDMLAGCLFKSQGITLFRQLSQQGDIPAMIGIKHDDEWLRTTVHKLITKNSPQGLAALLTHAPFIGFDMLERSLQHFHDSRAQCNSVIEQCFVLLEPQLQAEMLHALRRWKVKELPLIKAHLSKSELLEEMKAPKVAMPRTKKI